MKNSRSVHLWLLGIAFSLLACQAPEPGTPERDPSPLFPGYESYRTLAEVEPRLPARPTWKILFDGKSKPRKSCPRLDEFTFAVAAEHLCQAGVLQLTFINGRLEATLFTPNDFGAYLSALDHSGTRFDGEGTATLPPATRVWKSNLAHGKFVGWRDTRFSDQVSRWIGRCS